MGTRGPQKKPSTLNELHGNPGKRKINNREPRPDPLTKMPYAPLYFNKRARDFWHKVGRRLIDVNILTAIDLPAFETYCYTFEIMRTAADRIANDGGEMRLSDLSPHGEKKLSHLWKIYKQAAAEVKSWSSHFGLTAGTRPNIRVYGKGSGEENSKPADQTLLHLIKKRQEMAKK